MSPTTALMSEINETLKETIYHKDCECKECAYVPNIDSIFQSYVTKAKIENSEKGNPIFCGKFCMDGWTGHSGFYLFKCKECNGKVIDYAHGYTYDGLFYLRCPDCQTKLVLDPVKHRFAYRNEEAVVPPPTKKQRLEELYQIIGATGKGAIVIPTKPIKQSKLKLFWLRTLNYFKS
ncbi:hypothetical protein KW791_01335 [Candidatus Parcubacteria bacterium]|nr:hypothetical protein [Candidatus Parcubacteria bacterium]